MGGLASHPRLSANGWTYLAYLIQAPMVTSVTNLDLNAFVRDAVSRGYVQNSWYLYAIQAGDEIRTGGLPYNNNSFSVSINGATPAIPDAGAACHECVVRRGNPH